MKKTVHTRIPCSMYNYLKNRAKEKETSMRIEASTMFDEYFKLKKLESSIEKRRGKFLFVK